MRGPLPRLVRFDPQRLDGAAVHDTDEQQPPCRGLQLACPDQQLHAGQLRHPLVGDHQRDWFILVMQPRQQLERAGG
jgi:hypothetical protein